MSDNVNHPAHYNQYRHEVIWLTERCDFCLGNCFKYILRAPFKGNRQQDIRKSIWYAGRYIKNIDLHPEIDNGVEYRRILPYAIPFIEDMIRENRIKLCLLFMTVLNLVKKTSTKDAEPEIVNLRLLADDAEYEQN